MARHLQFKNFRDLYAALAAQCGAALRHFTGFFNAAPLNDAITASRIASTIVQYHPHLIALIHQIEGSQIATGLLSSEQ